MGLSCLRLLSHVSHDNAKFSDRIVFWSCNKSFVDQALLRYNCLLGSFYVGILYTLTSSWSIKTPKKSLSEYSAILMYTCHLCSHASDNYALLVKAWKGIHRFRPLLSSPLPYTVFAPTLFEFDPSSRVRPLIEWYPDELIRKLMSKFFSLNFINRAKRVQV